MQQPLSGVPGIKVLHSGRAFGFTDLSEESLGIPEGMNSKLTGPHTHYCQQYDQANHTSCLAEKKQQLCV